MALFKRRHLRSESEQPDQSNEPPAPVTDENVLAAARESERLEQIKRDEEEAANRRHAILAQKQAELDAQVDNIVSSNSENFLERAVQPGGE